MNRKKILRPRRGQKISERFHWYSTQKNYFENQNFAIFKVWRWYDIVKMMISTIYMHMWFHAQLAQKILNGNLPSKYMVCPWFFLVEHFLDSSRNWIAVCSLVVRSPRASTLQKKNEKNVKLYAKYKAIKI